MARDYTISFLHITRKMVPMVGFEPTTFATRVRNFKFRVFQPLHHIGIII